MVNCIPPETLAHILSFAVPRFKEPSDPSSPAFNLRSSQWSQFMPLTLVCRVWRDVILSSPLLWTLVDATGMQPGQLKTLLARSGILSLDVIIDWDKTPREAVDLVAGQLVRMRKLSVILTRDMPPSDRDHDALPILPESFCDPAPLLISLYLQDYSRPGSVSASYCFPEQLADQFPHVRTLHLEHFTPPGPGNLKNLTTLHISNSNGHSATIYPILDVLRANSHLHTAVFENANRAPNDLDISDIPKSAVVALHHLRRLDVRAGNQHIQVFLSCPDLPPQTCITIYTEIEPDNHDDHGDVVSALRWIFPYDRSTLGPLNAPIVDLTVAQDDFFCTVRVDMRTSGGGDVCLRLIAFNVVEDDELDDDEVACSVLTGILGMFTVDQVTTLTVPPMPVAWPAWDQIFGHFPALHTLTVQGPSPIDIIFKALMPEPVAEGADKAGRHSRCCCPDLSSIYLHCRRIACDDTITALRDLVQARQGSDRAICEVVVCDLSEFDDSYVGRCDRGSFELLAQVLRSIPVEVEIPE